MLGQWGMMSMGVPWIGVNPMMTGRGMGVLPPWFGVSQFGRGMAGMDMQAMSGMSAVSAMNNPSGFQGQGQGSSTASARDSGTLPLETGAPQQEGSSQH